MSLHAHLAALEQRHSVLDEEIAAALSKKPAMSDGEIGDMKRKKLKLKEEIERLRSTH